MKKVICISYVPCADYIAKNYFFDHLISKGIDVEYWDLSSVYTRNATAKDGIYAELLTSINTKKELKEKISIQSKEDTIFFTLFTFGWDTLWVYRLLKEYKCHTGWFDRPGIPSSPVPSKRKIYRLLDKITLDGFLKSLQHRASHFIKYIGMVDEPKVVFSAGRQSKKKYENTSEIVEVNDFDYEDFLSLRQGGKLTTTKPYAVFLDSYSPYHPDFDLLRMPKVEPVAYYRSLNNFFDIVEKKYAVKIIIAAHPKSDYNDDVFKGRERYKHKTNELVRSCQFVLAHGSSSLSFAVLYYKQLIFMYDDQFEDLYQHSILRSIRNLAQTLQNPIYNVDKIKGEEEIILKTIDMQSYDNFKYNFLTSPKSEKRLTQDLLLEYLRIN